MTCHCSEHQLNQVGCDCEHTRDMAIVYVWPLGYASEKGPAKLYVDGGESIETTVDREFGCLAKICRITYPNRGFPIALQVSAETARLMSKNDNS